MKFHFYKYQATGNDFVLIDNRSSKFSFTKAQIEKICHRKFGVGADGLMLIEDHNSLDFNLVYFNRDGSQSLCGNGSRAAVRLASSLGMVNGKAKFNAYDGSHSAELLSSEVVKLNMNDVSKVEKSGDDHFINTGSPHIIKFVKNLQQYPVFEEGRKIRYSETYKPAGTNVNFVELLPENAIFVRTYERGVENETLSCGTGVVAAALAASFKGFTSPVTIKTLGGDLAVEFISQNESSSSTPSTPNRSFETGQGVTFRDIFLIGPAKLVFEGDLEL